MTEPAETRTAPLPLWRAAGDFLRTLFNLFGAPESLATQHTLTTANYRLILDWLRTAEAFVRHLLFIEASAYPKPAMATIQRSPRPRERRPFWFTADAPQAWRVSFRCYGAPASLSAAAQRAKADRQRTPKPIARTPKIRARFHNAWPLAERFEAVLRAYNDPAPFAKRLARRLYASAPLVARILKAPIELAHRIGERTCAEIRVLCAAKRACFADTT